MSTNFQLGGEGVHEVAVDTLADFKVTLSGTDVAGHLDVQVRSPDGSSLPLSMYGLGSTSYVVQYIPKYPGSHAIDLYYRGSNVMSTNATAFLPSKVLPTCFSRFFFDCTFPLKNSVFLVETWKLRCNELLTGDCK